MFLYKLVNNKCLFKTFSTSSCAKTNQLINKAEFNLDLLISLNKNSYIIFQLKNQLNIKKKI